MTYKVTCHCGAVELAVDFPDGLTNLKRCNCSICRRKGAIMAYAAGENVTLVKGEDVLSTYSFHTRAAQHHFCSVCGIYTHHRPRFDPALVGINTGCIEGITPEDVADYELLDGVNHPMDTKS